MKDNKKIILSGIQPSGTLCIGNYLGAIKNWVDLQHDYDSIFVVVDMHAITLRQNPAELRKRCLSFAAQFIACGIDPKLSSIFVQSHVSAHAELAWVLNCFTYMGELNRMTQFKDKSKKNNANINAGLFTYPILMASDILLYQADLVPVGADQKQHLELARNIAERFNNEYSPTFKIPEPYIPNRGARIMSLQSPKSKMSKSDENENNFIGLLDNEKTILKKIKRSVTDSGSEVNYQNGGEGLKNLINIYSLFSGEKIELIEEKYKNQGYKEFKDGLTEVIIESLKPIQKKYHSLIDEKSYLEKILNEGSTNAMYRSRKTIQKVYRKIGFPQFKS
ncbi:MAG: tryptophan--tRNA ligase [Candidatus Marinimicrobia bacterium]|nr:tryptophan--tRNA ligase [Candidatus Neomarinimicrobiota bacterium]